MVMFFKPLCTDFINAHLGTQKAGKRTQSLPLQKFFYNWFGKMNFLSHAWIFRKRSKSQFYPCFAHRQITGQIKKNPVIVRNFYGLSSGHLMNIPRKREWSNAFA